MAEDLKIELPIESERLVIRPLVIEDAADLGESEEWIREKIDQRSDGLTYIQTHYGIGYRFEPQPRGEEPEATA